ncbi:copper transporter [Demequina sp. SYSU T00192]|uniref:Copper transporter n=1 Tax=Demequina litoralis TaxID=3051660 RepID=A0ABT8GCW7_9MICO|nr:copper transporter [Demequina sp. SYSU T00192]MDN4476988.1 copper transporter [Demequina sp. SYSU T00192]
MSDGRTRLVSAAAGIAVLATGVVLGSGPLRAALLGETGERIDTLESELAVQQERASDAEDRAATAAGYVDATAPTLLIDLLPGTAVVVVAAPGAPEDVVAALEQRLPLAGAEETGAVALGESWDDDATSQFRTALAEQVASSLVGVDAVEPAAVLAHAFVQGATGAAPTGSDRTEVGDAGTDRGAVLWDLLVEAELAEGEAATRADAILLVAGRKDATAALADAFAAYDAPVTVVGSAGAITAQTRRDDVATVASSDWTLGSVSAVATVSETLAGGRPHYGDGDVPAVLGVS